MIEIASMIAAIAAVIWARKQDIEKSLRDRSSRPQIAATISKSPYQYARYLDVFVKFLDRYMETVWLSLFFCWMLALAYSSFSFLFSLAVSDENYQMLPGVTIPGWQAKLLFAGICVAAIVNFIIARAFSKPTVVTSNLAKQRQIDAYHVFFATWFGLTIYVVLESAFMATVGLVIALGAAITHTTSHSDQDIFDKSKSSLFFASSLGAYAMLVVLLFFLAGNITSELIIFVSAIAITCGILTVTGIPYTILGQRRSFVKGDRFSAKALSLIGRPGLYVGFYCSRAPGSFCWAVSNLLWASTFLQSGLALPEPLVVSSSIVLMSSIYFAGAKSIIGAGIFAFANMAFITVFTFVFHKNLFFAKWPYLFVFWIILPFYHAIFDWLRLNVLRRLIPRYGFTAARHGFAILVADFTFGVACIGLYCVAVTYSIKLFNQLSVYYGFVSPIPIGEILDAIHTNKSGSGLWFLVVASTLMLPTLVTFIIYLAAGIVTAVPSWLRHSLAEQITSPSLTQQQRDTLAWKIAAIESLSGTIFFVAGLAALGFLIFWGAYPFAQFLYTLSQLVLRT